MAAGYEVFALNPMSVAGYRERHSTSGAQSDAADAHLLAEIVRVDRAHHRPVASDSPQADAVNLVARAHPSLVWDRSRHVLRLRAALREFFPAVLEAFADLDAPDTLELLGARTRPRRGRRLVPVPDRRGAGPGQPPRCRRQGPADPLGAAGGTALLHADIRADNLLLTGGGVFVVDWPHACLGAAFVDVVLWAPRVAIQGGPQPAELLTRSRAGRSASRASVTATVSALAGYFTERSLRPPPSGIPTVRAFQAAQGEVTRRWLAQLL